MGLPFFSETVDGSLNLHELLIRHPSATFFFNIQTNSAASLGIYSGDLAVIDQALIPKSRDIVLAINDGEFQLKRFDQDQEVRGVVTATIRRFHRWE